ncbi:unnamed protein product [Brassica oleracea var. botrytis]|uniref:H15 domain-containing protein n=2 Tax=Brassica oleracea TaxID=3712 RepID=A0A0D3AV93_BRAOL|nr:PREDICTED: uncharacterized protein LOC106325674 [Brassica oleracea var. oleracea]VDD25733.1 unnamed protein product [Brassica oleracea]
MENGVSLQQTPKEKHSWQIQELPFSLLPYPQMIMEAIEASNDAKGCSKTAILKHIETTQTHLPPSHLTLLDYHLKPDETFGEDRDCEKQLHETRSKAETSGRFKTRGGHVSLGFFDEDDHRRRRRWFKATTERKLTVCVCVESLEGHGK